MKLSELEMAMIETLRKRQQKLRRWRVPLLVFYGLLMVAFLVMLIIAVQFPGDPLSKVIVVAYSGPPIFFFFGLNSFLFGQTLSNWNGEPKTELLLKVISELQNRET